MKVALTARRVAVPIAAYFCVKVLSGLLLLKLSTALLSIAQFSVFSQFLIFGALVTMVAIGGSQNGVVREVAAGDGDAIGRSRTAATAIWSIAGLLIAVLSVVAAAPISEVLTGHRELAWAVPLIAIAALLSGPGQIAFAILTGLGRTHASLAAQALGLFTGTAACAVLLYREEAVWAAIAFYAGSLLSVPVALWALRGLAFLQPWPVQVLTAEIRNLLRYSGGFVIIAGITALILFGLRYAYLSHFGAEQLALWLVAQRISDTSTQLLGLFMIQFVLPAYAACPPAERWRLLQRSWLAATGVMTTAFLAFLIAPSLWVSILLTPAYATAIPMILIYMAGDIFRATASLAMHASLARSKVITYAGIEVASMTAMAVVTYFLVRGGTSLAPAIGYAAAYMAAALIILALAIAMNRRATSA